MDCEKEILPVICVPAYLKSRYSDWKCKHELYEKFCALLRVSATHRLTREAGYYFRFVHEPPFIASTPPCCNILAALLLLPPLMQHVITGLFLFLISTILEGNSESGIFSDPSACPVLNSSLVRTSRIIGFFFFSASSSPELPKRFLNRPSIAYFFLKISCMKIRTCDEGHTCSAKNPGSNSS
jgi:hypothetical protein